MNALAPNVTGADAAEVLERVIAAGDLARLAPEQRVTLYNATCQSLGLNPLTRPFEFIQLNGKLVLYARKDATDQLRALKNVTVEIASKEISDGMVIVTARATLPNGRRDEDMGAVPLPASGEARANAMLKAMTKAKRRVTLSICGLGFLDETEVEDIPAARGPTINAERTIPDGLPAPRQPAPAGSMRAEAEAMQQKRPVLTPDLTLAEVPARAWKRAVTKALNDIHDLDTLNGWWQGTAPLLADPEEKADVEALVVERRAEVAEAPA